MLSKLISKFTKAVNAFTSDKPARAAVGAALYVGKAGDMSEGEFDTMIKNLRGNPRFADVDLNTILGDWEKYTSERLFKRDLMDLLAEVGTSEELTIREDIGIIAIEVADAEADAGDRNKISPAEQERLDEIGKALMIDIKKLV